MRRSLCTERLLALVLVAVPSGVARASGGAGGHGFEFTIQGFYIINFLVLVGLLVFFVRKPLARFLQRRHETFKSEMDEALALKAAAQAKLDEYSAKLAGVDQEIADIRRTIREQAERERERILAEAQVEAARIEREARLRADQEARKLRATLESRLLDRAVAVATDALRQQATPAQHQKFVDDYLKGVEALQVNTLGGVQS